MKIYIWGVMKFLVLVLILLGLVGCSNDQEYSQKVTLLERELEVANTLIEEKENEIAKLEKEKIELQKLQEGFENSNSPYYVDTEVRSENDERLKSYAFILDSIGKRISNIDELLDGDRYNDEQIGFLNSEREFVWELGLIGKRNKQS
jgi:hypothetical protein